MYDVYLGGTKLPITPSAIQVKYSGRSKSVTLINDGDINILRSEGLQEISFDALFPNTSDPYHSGSCNAGSYVDIFRAMMNGPVQLIVSRALPDGTNIYSTNIKVGIESITQKEDVKYGVDAMVSFKLKEWKAYGTKIAILNLTKNTAAVAGATRDSSTAPVTNGSEYAVSGGDSLWKIAKAKYGDGSKWKQIYEANKDKVSNPNLIYPGQKLIIP